MAKRKSRIVKPNRAGIANDVLVAPHRPMPQEAGTVIRLADGAVFVLEASDAEPGKKRRVRQPPIERYGARGQLDARQVQAARNWYRDWAQGLHGVEDCDRVRTFAAGPALRVYGPREGQVLALSCWRESQRALARSERRLVELVVCHEIGAGEVAEAYGLKAGAVMEVLRRSLNAIASYYML